MVVVVHISALNDTEDLAGKPGTGQARRLGAWWKKTGLTVLFCTGLGSHGSTSNLTNK